MTDLIKPAQTVGGAFLFDEKDLDYWIARRKDGTAVKYVIRANTPSVSGSTTPAIHYPHYSGQAYSKVEWCKHDLTAEPLYSHPVVMSDGSVKAVNLFICDAEGTRKDKEKVDLLLDAGQITPLSYFDSSFTKGNNPSLVKEIAAFEFAPSKPELLRFGWMDRQAPELVPEVWPHLAALLEARVKDGWGGRVMCSCQGGHGRSGTMITALMMCYTNYTPLDAITHLRAVHCARAIESVVQHKYLNWLAETLGREQNALEAEGVKDFRARFLSLDNAFAKPYQERLTIKKEGK